MGLDEFPVRDGSFGGDGGAVAVVEVLAEAGGEVGVRWGFVAGREGEGAEGVDVAGEVDGGGWGGGGGEGGGGAGFFHDGVQDHYVEADVDAEADAFACPDFFAAEVDAVVVAVVGGGVEGVERLY